MRKCKIRTSARYQFCNKVYVIEKQQLSVKYEFVEATLQRLNSFTSGYHSIPLTDRRNGGVTERY